MVTDAGQDLFIGNRIFPEPEISWDRHTIFVQFSAEEFDKMPDGAMVSYSIGFANENVWREKFKDGEPDFPGAKFGRLQKSMINEFSEIQENSEEQILRRARSRTNHQIRN
jgi:hypothetical protein